MSDAAPAFEQDQPDAPEAPETDQPTGGDEESFTDSYNPADLPEEARTAYEEAYKRLQGDYTRKTQEIGEGRREAERNAQILQALQNPQTRAAVLQQYGIDLVDEEEDEFGEEPDIYSEVEQLKQWKAEQIAQAEYADREEQVVDFISEEIADLEESEGREFSVKEQKALDAYARAYTDQTGAPDVKGAYELLSGIASDNQKAWIESKKTPRPPKGGKPGSRRVDPAKETPEERQERLEAAADEARGSLAA